MEKGVSQFEPKPIAINEELAIKLEVLPVGLSWSKSGDRIVVWSKDGTVSFWAANGDRLLDWKAHSSQVLSSCWSTEGDSIATIGRDGWCKVWSLDGNCVARMEHTEGWVEHVKWSPLTNLIATACGKNLRLWSQSGALVDELRGHSWPITDICWHPLKRDLIASCAADGVFIWRVGEAEPIHRLNSKEYPDRIAFDRFGSVLAYGCGQTSLDVWTFCSCLASN